jgi:P-type Ca2+ transporter type 2C
MYTLYSIYLSLSLTSVLVSLISHVSFHSILVSCSLCIFFRCCHFLGRPQLSILDPCRFLFFFFVFLSLFLFFSFSALLIMDADLVRTSSIRTVRRGGDQLEAGRSLKKVFSVVRIAASLSNAFSGGAAAHQPAYDNMDDARDAALALSKNNIENFYTSSKEDIVHQLGSHITKGLGDDEAKIRLAQYGPNELEKEPPRPMWKLFVDQFTDLLVIMLIVSSIVSMALGQYPAAVTIMVIVLANAILGVVQEAKASAALDELENLAAPDSTVIRDGRQVVVPTSELVVGDIVLLATGRKIGADMRLVSAESLEVEEIIFTGESEPIKKEADFVGTAKGDEAPPKSTDTDSKQQKEERLDFRNIVYMGCSITDGHGMGVVVKTGMDTQMGEIATLLAGAEKGGSPLQEKLQKMGVKLGLASILISVVVFIIGVTTERGADPADDNPVWLQMLLVAVSLTVASVPEGLPACVTITLAIGMRHMAEKNALIRNLHSVETLGSASVICTDKTGTLTAGRMTAVRMFYKGVVYRMTGIGYDPTGHVVPETVDPKYQDHVEAAANELQKADPEYNFPLEAAVMCSNAELQWQEEEKETGRPGYWEAVGNASERPLVVALRKTGVTEQDVKDAYPRLHENPFSSKRKMMSTLSDVSNSGREAFSDCKFASTVKGAPNFILNNCTRMQTPDGVKDMTDEDRAELLETVDYFSSKAYRVLAVAYKTFDTEPEKSDSAMEHDLTFSALIASIDPEREAVTPSIAKAHNAGIRVVMITGDYVKTAKAIAENIHLLPPQADEGRAIDCQQIRDFQIQLDAVAAKVEANGGNETADLRAEREEIEDVLDRLTAYADVYARAKPADKITIVRSLQRQGNVCSMTGDGVNDAPALKQANIGVAMGITGTDVAKGAADMVLTDDNFVSIVEAIEEGRTIYANITKFVYFLLSTNVAEVFTILIAIIMGLQSPLLPMQILWLNLATDGAPAVALAIERTEPGTMQEGPRRKEEPLIEKVMITGIVIQTFVLTTLTLATYIIGLKWNTGKWNGNDPDGVKHARTMTILYIVFAELLRAYGSRSLRESIFTIGPFSNKWMQWAVGVSIVGTVFVTHVPGVMDLFEVKYMSGREWAWVLCMSPVPLIVDECTKWVYRYTGFGRRPRVIDDTPPAKQAELARFATQFAIAHRNQVTEPSDEKEYLDDRATVHGANASIQLARSISQRTSTQHVGVPPNMPVSQSTDHVVLVDDDEE